jgi:hypothetical protein
MASGYENSPDYGGRVWRPGTIVLWLAIVTTMTVLPIAAAVWLGHL